MKKKWSITLLTFFNMAIISILVINYWNNFDQSRFINQLFLIPHSLMITIVAINFCIIFFYGLRLMFLLETDYKASIAIASVGYAANNILPFRLGEVFRVYFANKKYGIPTTQTLVAMIFERVVDLFSISCLSFIIILLSAWVLPIATNSLYLILIGPAIFLVFALIYPSQVKQILCRILPTSLIQRVIQSFYVEFMRIASYQRLAGFSIYTLLIWVFTVMVFYIYFKGTLPLEKFTILDAISLTVCTALSLAISSLPASVGLFEGGIVYFLHEIKHIEQSTALALAIILHLLIVIPQCLSMVYFLLIRNQKVSTFAYD